MTPNDESPTSDLSPENARARPVQRGLGPALKALFSDSDWASRFWIVPLVSILPILNLVLLRGWRFEMVRRLVREENPALPPPGNIGGFFLNGLVLWLMSFLYHLPHAILILIHAAHLIELSTSNDPAFARSLLVVVAMTGAFWIFTWPLYRVAMLRFAATGSFASFFLLPQNFFVLLRGPLSLLLLWVLLTLSFFLFAFLSTLLSVTGIGVLIALIFLIPQLYATTGHLMAQVGSRFANRHKWLRRLSDGSLEPRPPHFISVLFGFGGTFLFLGTLCAIALLHAGSVAGNALGENIEQISLLETIEHFDFNEIKTYATEELWPQVVEWWENGPLSNEDRGS